MSPFDNDGACWTDEPLTFESEGDRRRTLHEAVKRYVPRDWTGRIVLTIENGRVSAHQETRTFPRDEDTGRITE